jgi:Uma2 family endonuclease
MTRTLLSYADYAALPETRQRHEIHDGELSVTPAPTPQHQMISIRLVIALNRWLETHPGGLLLYAPLDVILSDTPSETSIVQPDVVYLAPDRLDRVSGRGIEGGPTLAVEILSPSTRTIDRVTKRALYARYDVPVLWLVDPDARAIDVLLLEAGRHVHAPTARGTAPVDLPPFPALGLVPESLWP